MGDSGVGKDRLVHRLKIAGFYALTTRAEILGVVGLSLYVQKNNKLTVI